MEQHKLQSKSLYSGWDNPFQPSGSVSEDADLMLKMWKEERLSELYCHTEVLLVGEKDEVDGEMKNIDNLEISDIGEGVVEQNEAFDSTRVKTKLMSLCCSIM
eukprot:GFUD01132646.1.p1 GENE.GFUD01132646.1~~GFUD01132646.1.p1  ORF type:complete len:115 (+),score=42.27 GFUD01132646.1:37-345(+)